MKSACLVLGLAGLLATAIAGRVLAHCQVPCGIYTDSLRFDAMGEDVQTLRKAMGQIRSLAGKADAASVNQVVRWVQTKEEHATRIQEVIASYFMAQRIKVEQADYPQRLAAAHAVLQAAMICKQSTEEAAVTRLEAGLRAFRERYVGAAGAHPGHAHP